MGGVALDVDDRFYQPLDDEIDVAPVRGGAVGVVGDGEGEVADRHVARPERHVLARPHEFHHGQGEIGEAVGVGCLLPDEEPCERLRIRLCGQGFPALRRLRDDPLPVLRPLDDPLDHGKAGVA
ncbi:hypothetical protein ES707_14952 [subsurface metagenome]